MPVFPLDTLRHETPFVLGLVRRDAPKRLASAALVLGVCGLAGWREAALWTGLAVLVFEASGLLAARRLPSGAREAATGLALWTWATNVLSTGAYMVPALLLVVSPELPWVIAGYLWIFGVYVHVTNSFVALPLYNWSQMAPAFLGGIAATGLAAAAHEAPANPAAWAVVLGLSAVYGTNTVETILRQKETQAALDAARAEARARLAALEEAARIDPLTGLLNRQAFDASLARLLADRRAGREVAVLGVDLDGFKPLNDTHGHAAGDSVLAAVGRRLAALAGDRGIAGRLGGDELAVAIPGLLSTREALGLGLRLAREVERPVIHDGVALRVGASVGVALSWQPGDATAPEEEPEEPGALADRLLAGADRAMLQAKASARAGGDPRPVLHDPRSSPPRRSPGDRERLAEALALGEVVPRYHPILDLAAGTVAGFGTEPAWEGPAGEGLAGAALHDRVEELGLQGALLTVMATQVLRDLDGLALEGLDPGRVALRLPEMALATASGRRDLDRLLAAHPAGRARLEVALPGDALANRAAERVRDGVAHLRAMGLAVAITGFGTGRAGFRHLGQVDLDELRIDASFVARLGRERVARVAVEAMVAIAGAFGARLVAEGIETAEQRATLLALGCARGTGPHLGRPLDARGLRRLLALEARLDPDLPPREEAR